MCICHYFESILVIYVVACWFLSSKIQQVSSSKCFPQKFSPDLLEKFCLFGHCLEKEKYGNHLVQGLVNMVDKVEETNRNPIFYPAWFLPNVVLSKEKHNVSPIDECKKFSEKIFIHVVTVESISPHWESDYGLKTQNNHPHSVTLLPWSFTLGVGSRDSSTAFYVGHCHKRPIFYHL